MKQINLNNFKVITDNLNTYFKNNKIMIGSSVPTGGSYSKGDIIVNNGANADKEPMWICVESGNPGKWEVVGVGGTDLVHLKNNVIVNNAVSEVSIGIDGFNPEGDVLTVYRNSVYMIEGVDYEVQGNKIVSLKGNWNAENQSDYKFTFEVLKAVDKVNPDAVVGMENLKDDVRNAIEAAGNIDLSGYQGKNDNNLATTNKTVVGAINELFQSANNGKQLIASAIGEPLDSNDTFSAMSDKINNIKSDLKQVLTDEGVSVSNNDSMASLIGKVDSEFTKDNTTISELEADIENTRNTLAGLMQEGGYDITGNDTIDGLLDLLIVSGIKSDEIKQISSGNAYSMLLTTDSSLYATGSGSDGRTGLGDTVNRMAFVNVLDDVVQVACGNNYTLVVKNDGSLWGCGFNEKGQLGLSGTADRLTFTKITTGVKQVACGYSHSVILKTDGTVWACGDNTYGQLGLGNTTNKTTFTKVTTNVSNVKQIACGENHTVMLKTDGSLYSCGRNGSGQLGLGSTTDKTTFTKITTNVNNDVKQVACGKTHVFILKNDGSVWACGYNTNSYLGVGSNNNITSFTQVTTNVNNDVKQIACGEYHTLLLKNDGSVWGCGANSYGQLGLGDNTNQKTFTKVTTNINNDVKQIYCGGSHTFILKNDSSVWACGSNGAGGLGLCTEPETINSTFIKIPKSF